MTKNLKSETIQVNNNIYINGELIKLPKKIKRNSQTIINENGRIYINGYKYCPIKKEFKFSVIGFIKTILF